MADAETITAMRPLFPSLNEGQIEAIRTVGGPLQIEAGPGSGKTLVLILRTLYLLLTGRAVLLLLSAKMWAKFSR
jgi:ATP-dependent exoDNAse (exonuclease V) beta subunit